MNKKASFVISNYKKLKIQYFLSEELIFCLRLKIKIFYVHIFYIFFGRGISVGPI